MLLVRGAQPRLRGGYYAPNILLHMAYMEALSIVNK